MFDGNLGKDRQLCAALYVRPVSAATSDVPPSASITSLVDCNSVMATERNPRKFGNQPPKECGLGRSPNIFYNESMGRPITTMPEPGTTAHRARSLREAMGYQTQKAFAERYGFSANQWNNFERGSPISRIAAQSLKAQIPGLTTGWILDGDPAGLSLDMARRLGVLPPEAP